jgi:PAS domain S-box-containing protein
MKRQTYAHPPARRPAWLRYGTAVAAAFFGLLLRFAVGAELGRAAPYLTFFPLVVLSAWFGGFGSGLVTTALSALFATHFFVPNVAGLQAWGLLRFIVGAVSFSWFVPTLVEGQRRVRAHQRWAAVTLSSIGDAVLTTDALGRVTFMNPAAVAVTGWDAAEAAGQDSNAIFRLFSEQTGAPLENPAERLLREGTAAGLENHTLLETKAGARIPIDDSVAPIKDDEGQITGAVLIFRDIGKARQAEKGRIAAEEQLARSERQLSSIIESISDGFVALDREWCFTYVNAEAARLAHMNQSEMIGKKVWELFPQAIGSPVYNELQRSMEEQTPVTQEVVYTEYRQTLRLRAYPSTSGISIYIVDISKEKEAAASTALLAAIVESSSDAIIGEDLDGVIKTWNKGAEQIFGYTAAEMIGQPVTVLAVPGGADELPMILERICRGERVEHYETLRRTKSGRVVDVSLTVSPIRNAEGQVVGASKVARDITDRKAAEQALRSSEARLTMALEAGSMGVWEWDIRSGRVAWSSQLEVMHGIEPGSFGGTFDHFRRKIHSADRDRVLDALARAVEARADYRTEYRAERPDQRLMWVETCGRIVFDECGEPDRMLGVSMDITARKAADEELLRQRDKLARSNADLRDLTYAASHDLQEPLRNVATFVQLLAKLYKGKLDADADELISFILQSTARMTALIKDLLGYSRVISGGQSSFTDVALNDAVDSALRNVQAAVMESGAAVDVGPLPTVRGDQVQLVQLFQNLISNAIKYRSSEPPRIQIAAAESDGEWLLSVRDNGEGIDPSYREMIFGVFKRLHGSDYPGTGMGLAICKRIVEKHGGRIWVESEPGQGATFRFSIVK